MKTLLINVYLFLASLVATQRCANWILCGANPSDPICVDTSSNSNTNLASPSKKLLSCPDGTKEQCVAEWNRISESDGCSGPALEPLLFKPACYQHDICFSTRDASWKNCNDHFKHNMDMICLSIGAEGKIPKPPYNLTCLESANINYQGVSMAAFSMPSFIKNQNACKGLPIDTPLPALDTEATPLPEVSVAATKPIEQKNEGGKFMVGISFVLICLNLIY